MPESAAAHALLVKVQADVEDIDKVINGLSKLSAAATATSKTALTLGSAFTLAGVEIGLQKIVGLVEEVGKKIVEVTVNFVKESIDAAAQIQTETFPLTQMLHDHAEVAEEVLHNLHGLWQELGVVSNESLGTAARNLLLIGTPAENLIERLRELSKIAVGTGNDLTNVVAAWQRFRQASETGTEPAVRGMGGFGAATEALAKVFAKTAGIILDGSAASDAAVKKLVANGKIGIPEMITALQDATRAGGEFFDVIDKKKETWDGAIQDFKTAWKGLQVTIGEPIINALTPIINNLSEFTRKVTEIAHDQSWQLALQLSWNVVMHKLGDATRVILRKAFEAAGSEVADAFFWFMLEKLAALIDEFFPAFVKNLFAGTGLTATSFVKGMELLDNFAKGLQAGVSQETRDAQATLQKFFDDILRPSIDFEEVGRNIGAQLDEDIIADLQKKLHPDLTGVPEGGKQDVPARNLAAAMHDLQAALAGVRQEQALLAANPFIMPDERQAETIKKYKEQLADIVGAMAKLRAVRDSPFMNEAQIASANQKLQESEARVKSIQQSLRGLATPLKTELSKWAQSFGTTAHQIAQTIEGTINASLQSLNQYLVTGKFNAQALLQQIVLLGLQLIEQLAIQQVMRAINRSAAITEAETTGPIIASALAGAVTAQTIASAGAAAVAAPFEVAAAVAGVLGVLSAHEGGLMRRRMHSGGLAYDEVPIIAQEGEIMIRRSVAQAPGMADFLLGLNSGMYHSGGFVWGGRYHAGGIDSGDPFGRGDPTGFPGGQFPRPIPFPSGGGSPFYHPPDLPPISPGPSDLNKPPFTTGGIDRSYKTSPFYDPEFSNVLPIGFLTGYGPTPSPAWGPPAFGPTQTPTFWVNYPGVGNVPMAVPIGGWQVPDTGIVGQGTPQKKATHFGGLISRFHSGGAVGGSGGSVGSGIHIYAFTDLRQLTKHMASKEGQKIIFDTVKGRRIDLGIS